MNKEKIEAMISDDIAALSEILKNNKVIAVVGLSANWYRPSFFAAKYMQGYGYQIVPVNPNYQEILGEKCYPSLHEIPFSVDVVDVFQRPQFLPPIAKSAVDIQAKVLWMQLGINNLQAAKLALDAGLKVVSDRCMKIEHGRLFGGLNFIGVDTKIISSARPRWVA